MTTAAIIVAAGRGRRAGGGTPKQWQMLAGRRVADWTLQRFRLPEITHIVMVLPPDDAKAWNSFAGDDLILVQGGAERAESVRSGLRALQGRGVTHVLIHDVARPCVSTELIRSVLNALREYPAAAPGLAVTDALWRASDGFVGGTQDRAGLFAAQTPQGFDYDRIRDAHESHMANASDDVEVARLAGMQVAIVPGEADNLKITRAEDFARAERILGRDMTIRLGNGYDVHRFGPGDHVVLCGIRIPHGRGLQGHSDADVGMHAVTDAIYGALAQGDIGRHFPPSDPQWKGAASETFLKHAVQLAAEMGYGISNIDCTLVCEHPKIGPYAVEMQSQMAQAMRLQPDQVSIKATTSERLGFTGREEGIAAIATACLVRP